MPGNYTVLDAYNYCKYMSRFDSRKCPDVRTMNQNRYKKDAQRKAVMVTLKRTGLTLASVLKFGASTDLTFCVSKELGITYADIDGAPVKIWAAFEDYLINNFNRD